MKLCKVSDLVGNEVVAKTVMTHDYQILLSEGTIIKKIYIKKLQEYNIDDIYIRGSELRNTEGIYILKKDMEDHFRRKLQTVFQQHFYKQSEELVKANEIATVVIESLLANDNLLEQVYEMKRRSNDLYEHSINMSAMAVIVSLYLKYDEKKVHNIAIAGLLHDIGFRYMDPKMATMYLDDMSKEELDEYRKHPVYAFTSLEGVTWLSENSKRMILCHHERQNVEGFPLKHVKLSTEQSILAVCEAFDERICGMSYPKMEVSTAIEYLKSLRGVAYSEKVIDAFIRYIAVFPLGSKVILSDGSKGIIVKQNTGFPERPVIQIVTEGGYGGQILDLLKTTNVVVNAIENQE